MGYNIHNSRNDKLFVTHETVQFTAVTPTNADATRLTRGQFTGNFPTNTRADKTGELSLLGGQLGRINGSFSITMDLAGGDVVGGPPDANNFISSCFGKAGAPTPTVSPTSFVYALDDTTYMIDAWDFAPTGFQQIAALASVVTDLEIAWGDNFGVLTINGVSAVIMDDNFLTSGATTAMKMGLSSYPTVPTTPVTHGGAAVGFTGQMTVDSNIMAEVKTGNMRWRSGRQLIQDSFGTYVATGVEAANRTATISFLTDDSDTTALKNVMLKAKTKAAVNTVMTVGTIAGNTWTGNFNNMLFNSPARQDGQIRFQQQFPESLAYESAVGAKDESTLVIT
jgi:hypothetical protein